MAENKKPAHLYIVAGPNGAGKTTFAKEFLPHFAHCQEFINTDLVAAGLSPFNPKTAAIEAARFVLKAIKERSSKNQSFALETTLSGRSYQFLFRKLKKQGYRVTLLYLWIPNVQTAIQRVKDRVRRGGHDVPEPDIRRRFARGLKNFFSVYQEMVDEWLLYDNSGQTHRLVAFKKGATLEIVDKSLYNTIQGKLNES